MKNIKDVLTNIFLVKSNEINSFKDTKHEKNFLNQFINNGYIELNPNCDKAVQIKKNHKSLDYIPEFKNKYYIIYQPFGSQKYPDFIIVIDGFILWIELKRSSGKKISWNTGYPRQDVLYVFDGSQGRIMFFGQDHPHYGGKEIIIEHFTSEWRKVTAKLIESDINYKFLESVFYARPMFNDSVEYTYNREELYDKTINSIDRKLHEFET